MENNFFTINREDFETLSKKQNNILKFTSKRKKYFDDKIFIEYSDLNEKLDKTKNEDVKWYLSKIRNINEYHGKTMSNFLIKYNDMHYKDSWLNATDDKDEIKKSQFFRWVKTDKEDLEVTLKTDGTEKQNAISSWLNVDSWNVLKDLNYIDREIYEKKLHLNKMIFMLKNLKLDGKYLGSFFGWSQNQTIDLLYLYLLLFRSVTIYFGKFIFCNIFEPLVNEKKLESLYTKKFIIEEKPKINELEIYLIEIFKYKNKNLKSLINGNIENVIKNEFKEKMWITRKLQEDESKIYKIFFEIFKRFVSKEDLLNIHSSINQKEGEYISLILRKFKLKKCLEIGFANGISALYILSSNRNVNLISIDPFQSTQWKNQGLNLLKESKLDKRHKLIEKKSYEALPELLKKEEGKIDFIFIDGWHTFDYTLIDFFYADKLLRKGGIIIVDDAKHLGVAKCIKYIDTNYRDFYYRLKSHKSIACFKKIDYDKREWNYHRYF